MTTLDGWTDITSSIAADRRTANVSVAWRRPNKGRPKLEFLLNNRLTIALGWKDGIHASILASPDRREIAFVPHADGKLLRDRSGGLQVSHGVDWIADDAPARQAEITPHRVEGTALIVTLPAWAQPAGAAEEGAAAPAEAPPALPPRSQGRDKLTAERELLFRKLWPQVEVSALQVMEALNALPGEPYTNATSMHSLATRLGLPTDRTAGTRAPAAAPAQTPVREFPPAHFRKPVVVAAPAPAVLEEDEREAEALIRANPEAWDGRAIAEEYGWTTENAAAFVQRSRKKIAAERRGAAE